MVGVMCWHPHRWNDDLPPGTLLKFIGESIAEKYNTHDPVAVEFAGA